MCIDDFDHHCFWVNNCIGGNNLSTFIIFLLSVSLNLILNMAICIYSKNIIFKYKGLIHTDYNDLSITPDIKLFPLVYYFIENLPAIILYVNQIAVLIIASLFFLPVT